MDQTAKALGKRIRALRAERGLTQERLSELADVSLKHLGLIERGLSNPTLSTLDGLARALSLSLAELLDLEHQRLTDQEMVESTNRMLAGIPEDRKQLAFRILKLLSE